MKRYHQDILRPRSTYPYDTEYNFTSQCQSNLTSGIPLTNSKKINLLISTDSSTQLPPYARYHPPSLQEACSPSAQQQHSAHRLAYGRPHFLFHGRHPCSHRWGRRRRLRRRGPFWVGDGGLWEFLWLFID
ncbi:hypothetical protein BDV12DRAFT_107994 [Aspergillus spectabilis]